MVEQLAPEDLIADDWGDLSTSDLGPGARLGRYELLIPIAYGGMARVWAARLNGQRGFSKLVAVKTILPHLAHDPEFERMFLDEGRIAAGVHHPNVCEIYELGEEGHCLYLAMEWVPGESLVHVLRQGKPKSRPIDVRIAARIAADACAGLHAAHGLVDEEGQFLGVVHRDVSPHNILVTIDGTVKVVDFGVAKALGQMHNQTVAGQIKGKVAYMAPEQITGSPVDARADIHSMGCVLYEATTGSPPFLGENDPQIMQAVLTGHYALPTKFVRGYPPELEAILARALAPTPRMRFADAEQMRVALEEWLARSGPIVTPSHVAAVVRERSGADIDKRRDLIKRAGAMSDKDASWPGRGGAGVGNTPSRGQSRSGVMAAPPPAAGAPPPMQAPPMQAAPGRVVAPPPGLPRAPSYPALAPPPPRHPSMGDAREILPSVQVADLPPTRAMMRTPLTGIGHDAPAKPQLPVVVAAPSRSGGYVLAAIIGVGVALALGIGAIVTWRFVSPGTPSTTTTAPSFATAAPPPAALATSAKPVAAPTSSTVEFQVVPKEAILIVDGTMLVPTTRTVARPLPGQTLTVIVSAPGFVDEEVKLDDAVPPQVPVILTPVPTAALTATVTAAPIGTAYSGPAVPTTKATATSGIVIPPNPYKH